MFTVPLAPAGWLPPADAAGAFDAPPLRAHAPTTTANTATTAASRVRVLRGFVTMLLLVGCRVAAAHLARPPDWRPTRSSPGPVPVVHRALLRPGPGAGHDDRSGSIPSDHRSAMGRR